MKYRTALLVSLICASTASFADGEPLPASNRLALQAAITTNGNIGAGIANYSETLEYGFTVAGIINNFSGASTSLVVPAIFAGLRKNLADNSYFTYGLDLASEFGKKNGRSVNADIFIGPYVSIEQMLTHHVMLVGWLNPYSFEYEKLSGASTSTHRIFSSGGFGINYLFD